MLTVRRYQLRGSAYGYSAKRCHPHDVFGYVINDAVYLGSCSEFSLTSCRAIQRENTPAMTSRLHII